MPVHAQRGADLRVLLKPSRRQGGLPVPHSLHILPQRLDLAPQRLHLRAAVQAQDRAPFPRGTWCRSASGLRTRARMRNARKSTTVVNP